MQQALLEVYNLTKIFPGIRALDDVHLTVRSGEVHALIGENGAGKSTLVKILTGVYTPTAGKLVFDGKEIAFKNAIEAQEAGIVAIHQEASMFPELSVTENIYMGHHLRNPKNHKLDWKAMTENTRQLLAQMQLDIDPDTLVKNLSVAKRHMVEISKALSLDAKLVIMDEPTSALTEREVEDLFRIVRDLKKKGKAILFISHKFEEIFEICDYFTVLRDGQYIKEGLVKDSNEDEIINMMIGRSIDQMYPQHNPNIGEVVLKVSNLSQLGAFKNISFELHRGEILGFFGLVGAGRTEVVRTIFGIDGAMGGTMEIDGKPYAPRSPRDAMHYGLALVPEDRQKQGLVLKMSLTQNISLPVLDTLSWRKLITRKKCEKTYVLEHGNQMEIKSAGYHVDADTLSGGNQQKVVLAKWIGTDPKILILDEPTKGIDVATKAAVHEFVCEMASRGVAVILISSELPEVIGMADRILVMHEGCQTAILANKEITAENVMRCAIGNVQTEGSNA
ncbi:ABC-type sugar transport system, ATPase component [Sphaerochaeta pleomorpha str. Grapes]|uniref:ABC-type sugar transport system, ATPase component n=1 Tax=Sphaerochaeta pleomorpha (strain ATCC BAA-1885 / DSM 22778 / Grapes) TaxID=158190 RepID=G8QUN6_SPHPG|nr:sugar ABC transporter ATP-binding protein [Sphaerochaeta pleomorpha]AEV30344.1 ABC-type sugar transport system, ATPase component [Sphaerochaeta pleomorpha str. Grapes]